MNSNDIGDIEVGEHTPASLMLDLQYYTNDLTRFLIELAEVEVAEHDAFIAGYYHSTSSTETGRKYDGQANAREFHIEKIRLNAKVEIKRVQRETILTLLTLPAA